MKNLLFILLLLTLKTGFSQNADELIFAQKIRLVNETSNAETAINFAKSFIGQPYKAGTLEINSTEQLVCNLKDFDCSTFVESVVALTLTKFSNNSSYENYKNILKSLRYRNNEINGYASRLHYFREWIIQAEVKKIAQDITSQIGGIKQKKSINFMTENRDLYPKLKEENAYLEVKTNQKMLNDFDFFYIPKWKLEKVESQIKDGDIIAITSNVDGLDYNHEGFAIRQNGRIYLLHASYEVKKVIISKEPLVDYLNRVNKHSGISVIRLL